MNRHAFSMVEILLALGVIAIGICSIMVLFPVGSSASRDTIMDTYASNCAEQMLNMVKYKLSYDKTNWNKYTASGSGDSLYKSDAPEEPASLADDLEFSPETNAHWANDDDLVKAKDLNTGIFRHKSHKNFFQIVVHRGDVETELENINAEDVDFRAVACLWISNVVVTNGTSSGTELSMGRAARINLKLSWPAELPESARQSAFYTLEVFNNK